MPSDHYAASDWPAFQRCGSCGAVQVLYPSQRLAMTALHSNSVSQRLMRDLFASMLPVEHPDHKPIDDFDEECGV